MTGRPAIEMSKGIRDGRTIFKPCQTDKLSAKTPVRELSLSTRLITHSGIVNRTDLRSCEVKAR